MISTDMKKILIVDDNTEIRELMKATLGSDDYCVLEASTGKEACTVAKNEHPDIVIMDVVMPGDMDGFEATRLIKSDPDTSQCHVIILTGMRKKIRREGNEPCGVDSYFAKPFSPLSLIEKVEQILENIQ
jgi:CheY-like chemotaxis protein